MTLTTSLILAVTTGCVSYMYFVMGLAHHRLSVAQRKSIGARNPMALSPIPHGDSELFLCPTLVTRRKTSFSISSVTELKTIYLSYSINDTHSLHLAGSYGVLRFWSKNLIWFDLFKAILFSFFKVISCSCFGYMLQNLAAHLPCFKVLQILFDLAFPFGTQLPYELLRSHLLVILSEFNARLIHITCLVTDWIGYHFPIFLPLPSIYPTFE